MKPVFYLLTRIDGFHHKSIIFFLGLVEGVLMKIVTIIADTRVLTKATWSLGGYEFGLEIESVLGKFEKTIYNDI